MAATRCLCPESPLCAQFTRRFALTTIVRVTFLSCCHRPDQLRLSLARHRHVARYSRNQAFMAYVHRPSLQLLHILAYVIAMHRQRCPETVRRIFGHLHRGKGLPDDPVHLAAVCTGFMRQPHMANPSPSASPSKVSLSCRTRSSRPQLLRISCKHRAQCSRGGGTNSSLFQAGLPRSGNAPSRIERSLTKADR